MNKWDKDSFIKSAKQSCIPYISNVIIDLVNFAESRADTIDWGRGKGYGTMSFKCKTDDYGVVPIFNLTTNGLIKFQVNYLRDKITKKEIVNDYQLKLESNFMMDFDSDEYPSDIYHELDELFNIRYEVDRFQEAVEGMSARLKQ